MNLQTFKASTMAEALNQVKRAMGHDAVILHTRTYQRRQWLGLRRREVVEITAGRGLNVGPRQPRRAPDGRASAEGRAGAQGRQVAEGRLGVEGRAGIQERLSAAHLPIRNRALMAPAGTSPGVLPELSGRASTSLTAASRPPEPGRLLLETPAANHAMMLSLTQEVGGLRTLLKDLVTETRAKQVPDVPEDLFEYYMQLISNQVAEELATEMLQTIRREVRAEHLTQPQFVRDKLAEQLEKLLPTSGPILRTKMHGPHVVALVGPTGVGKTTTIAKLAANLKLREKHRVGLITLDTYRIAAVDQLKKYADIIGSPLRVVGSPEDLREAIAAMSDCEYILIDTAGRSPNDTLKLNELRNYIAVAEPDEVHLVLSTTSSQACVELAVERFCNVRVDKIIFTKLDEAAHVGVVLNVVRKVNKSLSYITTGQDVPDDIEVGRGSRLAQIILGSRV